VAHSLLVTTHCLLSNPQPYADLGAGYFDSRETPEQQANRLIRKLQRLGYTVQAKPHAA